jgi:hypothetical protein
LTAENFLLRGILWFAIASLGMTPYFIALRRYRRAATAIDPSWGRASTGVLLDAAHTDSRLERMRRSCRRWLIVGIVIYFLLSPLLPWVLNG